MVTYIEERTQKCDECEYNVEGVCVKLREIFKERKINKLALISVGVKLPHSYCPIGKWDRVSREPKRPTYNITQSCKLCGNLIGVTKGICKGCEVERDINKRNRRLGVIRQSETPPHVKNGLATVRLLPPIEPDSNGISSNITIGIVTFNQPHKIGTCVKSVFSRYPLATVIVADNGTLRFNGADIEVPEGGSLKVLPLPFDCGLSKCRNELALQMETPYLLLMEDDFIVDERCDLRPMLDILRSSPEIGIVGGNHEHSYRAKRVYSVPEGVHYIKQKRLPNLPVISTPSGTPYQCVEFCSNFALFRRECALEQQWAEECKVGEHIEYYVRSKDNNRWIITHTKQSQIGHDRGRRTAHYTDYRKRAYRIRREVLAKWRGRATPTRLNVPPICVIVATIGRCGSSMVAEIMDHLGYSMAIRSTPTQWQSPRGYYEDETIRQICEDIIQKKKQKYVKEFNTAILRRNHTQTHWGIKQPRLLSIWSRVKNCSWPEDTRVVVIDRDEDEILKSMKRAKWASSSPEAWVKNQKKLLQKMIQNTQERGWQIQRLTYEQFLLSPLEQTQILCHFIGGDNNKIQAASKFVDPTLNHFTEIING